MREKLEKLLELLAVNYVLSPYETMPWSHYDETKGITCSAEVRMGPDYEDVEAEIQFFYDDKEDEEGSDGTGENAGPAKSPIIGGRQQILWMRGTPVTDDLWAPKILRVQGKSYVNEFHGWEDKGCEFFRNCVQALQMGEIPDIDEMVESTMRDDSWGGGRGKRGRVGKKSPKIKPAQLLGMKK